MKKNNFKSLAAVLSLAMAATALPASADAAAAPKLTVGATTVYSGETYSMTVKNLKKGYTVNFSSTNGGVNFAKKKVTSKGAKVSSKFTVKAAKNVPNNTKTKIKAVVRNANGKKVKSVTKTVTLKQLAKSITLKTIAQTTVKVGDTVNADATISPAAAKGAYKKNFTSDNSSVLEVTNASNGLFKAVAPGTATVSVTASNGDKVVESGTIEITVVEADDQGAQTPSGDNNNQTPSDTTGSAINNNTGFVLKLDPMDTAGNADFELQGDGKDQINVKITLTAPADYTNTKLQAAILLSNDNPGLASLSQDNVTLEYKEEEKAWVGYTTITSRVVYSAATAKINATVYSVNNADDVAAQLNGGTVNAQPITISVLPVENAPVDETKGVRAINVVMESCDRFLVTFDTAVTPELFMKDDKKTLDSAVANGKFRIFVHKEVSDTDLGADLFDRKANSTEYKYCINDDIAGILQYSDNTLEFVLKDGKELVDNQKFLFGFADRHTGNEYTSQVLSSYVVDTSNPTFMAVVSEDMKSIRVTFDQPVVSYGKEWLKSALNPANYTIDSIPLDSNRTYPEKVNGVEKSYYRWGEKSTIKIEPSGDLSRKEVIITLGNKDDEGNQQYFEPGTHILKVMNVGDYASLSEENQNNNIVEVKSLNFTVAENKELPNYTVKAQSPEQYIVEFSTEIKGLAKGTGYGQEITDTMIKMGMNLYYKVPKMIMQDNSEKVFTANYVAVTGKHTPYDQTGLSATALDDGSGFFKVTRLADSEKGTPRVKVEVLKDWTQLPDYQTESQRRLPDSYWLYVGFTAANLINPVNGLAAAPATNDTRLYNKIEGAVESYDGTSPKLVDNGITTIPYTDSCIIDIAFDEPVQGGNSELVDLQRGYAITPGWDASTEKDEKLANIRVQIRDNTTGKVYNADFVSYADLEDHVIRVKTREALNSTHKYTAYITGVSDDAGNTANTLSQDFELVQKPSDEATFKVLSILADKVYDDVKGAGKLDRTGDGRTKEAIYVEFSETPAFGGLLMNSVSQPSNWTVNGQVLPSSTQIMQGIVTGGKAIDNGVTILVNPGTITDVNATNVRLNVNLKAASGHSLIGKKTLTTQTIFKESAFAVADSTDTKYIRIDRYIVDNNGIERQDWFNDPTKYEERGIGTVENIEDK